MIIYRKIICPACSKVVESRPCDRVKQVTCKRCDHMYRVTSENASYYLDYCINGKRHREKAGFTKSVAEMALQKRLVEIAENRFLDVKNKEDVSFNDFSKEYFELHSKPNNKSWKRTDASQIRVFTGCFGGKMLSQITPFLIEKFRQERLKTVKAITVNRNLAFLGSMFNRAKEWDKFNGDNPVSRIKKFKTESRRERFLEQHEVIGLINACGGHIRSIVIIAVNTGMRRGEILNLKWSDIDLERGIIYLLNTKSRKKREVPMNEHVSRVFKDTPVKGEYVFANDTNGKPIQEIKRSFSTALRKCDINNFRFHDLRHTAASQMVMAGVELNTVREILGHSTIELTMRYAHLSPSHKKQAVDLLSERFASISSPRVDEQQVQENMVCAST